MKKKGVAIWALIGIILGIIILLVLVGITFKLISFEKPSSCLNSGDWKIMKEKFKDVENGKNTVIFFRNEGCYLVSFTLEELSNLQLQDKIIPQHTISTKKKPAICLCKLNNDICTIDDVLTNCYFFSKINNFKVNGQLNQLNTEANKEENYLFIYFNKEGSNLLINYYLQPSSTPTPSELPHPILPLNPKPIEEQEA